MEHPDPGTHEEEEVLEQQEVTPAGHPIANEISRADLEKGVDYETELTPEEAHVEGHPTPDHPTGRLGP